MKADLAQDARATLGEGPVWDQRSGRLLWVDIREGAVHRFSPSDASDSVIDVGQPVSAVGLGADDGLVLAIRDGFGLMRSGSDRVTDVIAVETEIAGNRMNDGRCDAAGRFWAGTMADRWESEPGAGALYRLERLGGSLVATKVLGGVTVSNGVDWTPDGRSMYYVDSATRRVDVFDFDVDTGSLSNRRVFAAVEAADGLPDGLVVDADGCVWVALIGGGRIRRYSPAARIDMEIRLPVTLVTSAAFGGPDLADLYITTARHRLTPEERDHQPHAGSLFACRPGPTGKAGPPLQLGLATTLRSGTARKLRRSEAIKMTQAKYRDTDLTARLAGEVALVTGGSQGIGRAIAIRLASEGASVAILDLDESGARHAAGELAAHGRNAIAIGCDVSDRSQVRAAIAEVVGHFGRLTVLVNNAGIIRLAPFVEMTDDIWTQVMSVNLTGTFIVAQEAARQMTPQHYGRIINMASVSAHIAHSGQTAYAVTKAGIEAMTRVMAFELAPSGIIVNAVAPGTIATSFSGGSLSEDAVTQRVRRIPLGRFGEPEEVAGVVALLASSDASYVTGTVIAIDGGLTSAGIRTAPS